MKFSPLHAIVLTVCGLSLPGCLTAEGHTDEPHESAHHAEGEHGEGEHAARKIVVTTPSIQDVTTTQPRVCQIHSRRNIEVRSLEGGYLEEVHVKEGQAVKQGDLMFKIYPVLFKAKLDTETAEAQQAQIEYDNSKSLFDKKIVSNQELLLVQAKLNKAKAELEVAKAELNFTDIRAPFDGIVDRQYKQHGSLIEEGEILSTLSDNEVMWVYFNVPEADYLDYMANRGKPDPQQPQHLVLPNSRIELRLPGGNTFNQTGGDVVTVEGSFNNETGNIAFRADFPNPDRLLRHGQTGTVLIHKTLAGATVIPQRATFEILDKLFVYVVDDEGVVHQHLIEIEKEMEDIYVVRGLSANDKIVLEGIAQVRDGQKVEYEVQKPEDALAKLKYHAE
jgi:membrane fusion protein, multidrug efflux system